MQTIIELHNVKNYLGGKWVHTGVDLQIQQGEILAIVGGSGSGKTTLLRSILMLLKPTAGAIRVFDSDVIHCSEAEATLVRHRWGMMFQHGALFSSLTVLENIIFPLRELTHLSADLRNEIALLKIALVGLEPEAALKYPAELSGGMLKRAAMARAMALDPEILFLDEPTAGLAKVLSQEVYQMLVDLRDRDGLTIMLVDQEIRQALKIADYVYVLDLGRNKFDGPVEEFTDLEKAFWA